MAASYGSIFAALFSIYMLVEYPVFDVEFFGALVVYTIVNVDSVLMIFLVQVGLVIQYYILTQTSPSAMSLRLTIASNIDRSSMGVEVSMSESKQELTV